MKQEKLFEVAEKYVSMNFPSISKEDVLFSYLVTTFIAGFRYYQDNF